MSGRAVPFHRKALASALMLALAPAAHCAKPGDVLPPGTLPQMRAVISGVATFSPAPSLLTVNQATQRAIIEWNSFNIARGSEVQFLFPNAGASSLNRIFDQDPSIIQGRLTSLVPGPQGAPVVGGQVYLINQNGIIFDRGSQINVGALLASTLKMSDDVFLAGLSAPRTAPALDGIGPNGPAGIELLGAIRTSAGGSVMVFAPQITNKGTISAPDGQVILAAGQTVWLTPNDPADFSMRGLVVEYQAGAGPVNLNSVINNQGTIGADRGNVSLAALAINQSNRVTASTAVLQNGSVWLLSGTRADSANPVRNGVVNLGTGSVTGTPLDTTDTTTLAEDQDYTPYRGQIRIEGKTIAVQGSVVAPGGLINITASDPENSASNDTSRVLVDDGGSISAAGSWVNLPMSKNLITVQLTSNELKDAPLQKGGPLLGQTVTIDIRKGTPLFDASGFVGNIKRTVAEKAATGGEINIISQGDVVMRPDATINVSGGGYVFAPGAVSTTKLLANGRVYDISQATPDVRYEQILNVFQYQQPRAPTLTYDLLGRTFAAFEGGDVQGKPGGTLSIIAAGGSVLEGHLQGGVTAGRYQLDPGMAPAGGSFVSGDKASLINSDIPNLGQLEVAFAASAALLPPSFGVYDPLPESLRGKTTLPLSFFQGSSVGSFGAYQQHGFGTVELYANDRISLAPGQSLELPAGGSLVLGAAHVDIEGHIAASAGSIDIRGIKTSSLVGLPSVVIGADAELSARGLWINDSGLASGGLLVSPGRGSVIPRLINGGSVSITTGDGMLEAGSIIDVTGGGRLTDAKSVRLGMGGSIKIRTGLGKDDEFFLGALQIHSELRGYGAGGGGSLDIHATRLRLANAPSGDPLELWRAPDFLQQGGFASYSLVGVEGAVIAAGTTLQPQTQTLVLNALAMLRAPTGADVTEFSRPQVLPITARTAANLSIAATGAANGRLTMETGSAILADPQGQVTLAASTGMTIRGQIDAPAGTISLSLHGGQPGVLGTEPLLIGSEARLSAQGYVSSVPNAQNLLLGEVLRGGQINITADKSPLVTEAGSVIDVSAVSGLLNVRAQQNGIPGYRRTLIAGDAGSIAIDATERTTLDGSLFGQAATGSVGGSFAFDFLRNSDGQLASLPHRLVLTQVPASDRAVAPGSTDAYLGFGAFTAGGFDGIRLRSSDQIEFRGDLALNAAREITLDAPVMASTNGGSVLLSAPHISLIASPNPLSPAAPPPAVATLPGKGTFDVRAGTAGNPGLLELGGSLTLNGFAEVHLLSAGDIRASGNVLDAIPDPQNVPDTIAGSLTTTANLLLQAAQIYPTTFSDYTFQVQPVEVAGGSTTWGSIRILPSGTPGGTVLSAGGRLAFTAQSIFQGGVVKAPLGRIELDGSKEVSLLEGSLTSVSGDGLVIPYGITKVGQQWFYAGIPVTAPPAKTVDLKGQTITLAKNTNKKPELDAVVDVSGGGELIAYEFVPGPGGSSDTLLAAGTYAVIPGLGSPFGPSDAQFGSEASLAISSDRSAYRSVYLSGVPGLPAGVYQLLPGHYALLPGAFVVRPQTDPKYRDMSPGQRATLSDGTQVVAGYWTVSGTAIRDPRWSGFAVEQASVARERSEYTLSDAQFFVNQALNADLPVPNIPADAGRVAFDAGTSLVLDGVIRAAAVAGNSGEVDISSSAIAVVSARGAGDVSKDALQLDAASLSRLGARLLLGGTRDPRTGATNVVAQSVEIANDASAPLSGPEIVLAARDSVTVRAGSRIDGTGAFSGAAQDLHVDGNGALLRVSSGDQVSVVRTNASPGAAAAGTVTVEAGAIVAADRSLLLDATSNTVFLGRLAIGKNGSLSLGSSLISLGETTGITGGLVLSNEQLAALPALDSLVLRSYQTIDLYGNAEVGSATLKQLVLDAAGLAGYKVKPKGAGSIPAANDSDDCSSRSCISAASIVLQNTSGAQVPVAPAAGPPNGTGALNLTAQRITFGAGAKSIAGFGPTVVQASSELVGSGSGSLSTAGDITLNASRITGEAGSDQSIVAGQVQIGYATDGNAALEAAPFGGKWKVTGTSVLQGGRFDLAAGMLDLTATSGDLVLAAGSQINAGPYRATFGATDQYAPGGTVTLTALNGNIGLANGALVDVSAAAQGGGAGRIVMSATAAGKSVTFGGTLRGAAATGQQSGSFSLDAGSLPAFAPLAQTLRDGQFGAEQDIRVRSGGLTLGPDDSMQAQRILVSVDSGDLTVASLIDASSAHGGSRVDLFAGGNLTLLAGSAIDAHGRGSDAGADPLASGGQVNLSARNGMLTFAQGASIDVSATGNGNAGTATFTAGRVGSTGVNVDLQGKLIGTSGAGGNPAEVAVVGNRTYAVSTITAAVTAATASNPIWRDYQQFVTGVNASTLTSDLKLVGIDASRVSVRAGIELQSTGNMTLSGVWNLADANWRLNSNPGVLTLRAAGNLDIRNALGLPNDNLIDAESWSLRLVGGADLAASDPLAVASLSTLATSGDVLLSTASSAVRTGTGSIEIAAGRNVQLVDQGAVIYSAGRPGFGGGGTNQYATGGGDVSVTAQQDIIGPGTPVWVNDWIRRTSGSAAQVSGQPAGWWTNRPTVRQAVAALGGGNVQLHAGRDVSQVYVLVPTSGRVDTSTGKPTLDVQGGGNLVVDAGRNITGGQFLVSLGQGTIRAGGDVGRATPTALYLMGLGSDPARSGATFSVSAHGDITLSNVSNPTLLALSNVSNISPATGFFRSHYFSYAPTSGVSLSSVAGDIVLGDQAPTRKSTSSAGDVPVEGSDIAPPRFEAVAFSGGISSPAQTPSAGRIRLYPSTQGKLRLLAAQDVTNLDLEVEDVVPDTLLQWFDALGLLGERGPNDTQIVFGPTAANRLVAPTTTVGYPYEIVAQGSIVDTQFTLPQRSHIQAGADIVNLQADLQNLSAADVTVVRAGRDIRYTPNYASGIQAENSGGYLRIGGPGGMIVQAGRNIDLGVTEGITALGANGNLSLTTGQSAQLTILAGVTQEVPVGDIDTLFDKLLAAGENKDVAKADAAIDSVFGPQNTSPVGNIALYFSSIRTDGGSGIDILAPGGAPGSTRGGNINAGLPSPTDKDIGIVTVLGGAIRTYLQNDFNVNQSKVITLQGGDIFAFTRYGSIDAGRGKRDSRTTQPPRRVPITARNSDGEEVDTGLFAYVPPLDASGSGIRTFTSDPDGPGPLKAPKPGDVFLIAPRGFVDAGEAGVFSAGNLFVFTPVFLNAAFAGAAGSSNLPVNNAAAAGAALSGAGNTGTAASKSADDATKSAAKDTADALGSKPFIPSFINVDVVGFGEDGGARQQKEEGTR